MYARADRRTGAKAAREACLHPHLYIVIHMSVHLPMRICLCTCLRARARGFAKRRMPGPAAADTAFVFKVASARLWASHSLPDSTLRDDTCPSRLSLALSAPTRGMLGVRGVCVSARVCALVRMRGQACAQAREGARLWVRRAYGVMHARYLFRARGEVRAELRQRGAHRELERVDLRWVSLVHISLGSGLHWTAIGTRRSGAGLAALCPPRARAFLFPPSPPSPPPWEAE